MEAMIVELLLEAKDVVWRQDIRSPAQQLGDCSVSPFCKSTRGQMLGEASARHVHGTASYEGYAKGGTNPTSTTGGGLGCEGSASTAFAPGDCAAEGEHGACGPCCHVINCCCTGRYAVSWGMFWWTSSRRPACSWTHGGQKERLGKETLHL